MSPRQAVVAATSAMARLYLPELVAALRDVYSRVLVVTYFPGGLLDEQSAGAIAGAGVEIEQFRPATDLERWRARRAAHRLIRDRLNTGPTDLFQMHPNQFLTNWICFDPELRRTLDVRLHLMPDGLANYYIARLNTNDQPTRGAKVSNRLLGIPYHHNEGTVLGLESIDYESYWYVGSPGMMADHMATHRFGVSRPASPTPRRDDTWLFLGQPSVGRAFGASYAELLTQVLDVSHGGAHYKPHPFEKSSPESLARIQRLGFTVVESSQPAEWLALGYGTVSGVLSSALVNLRALAWHDSVYGVLEPLQLAALTSRTETEARQISQAAARLGIRPISSSVPTQE